MDSISSELQHSFRLESADKHNKTPRLMAFREISFCNYVWNEMFLWLNEKGNI